VARAGVRAAGTRTRAIDSRSRGAIAGTIAIRRATTRAVSDRVVVRLRTGGRVRPGIAIRAAHATIAMPIGRPGSVRRALVPAPIDRAIVTRALPAIVRAAAVLDRTNAAELPGLHGDETKGVRDPIDRRDATNATIAGRRRAPPRIVPIGTAGRIGMRARGGAIARATAGTTGGATRAGTTGATAAVTRGLRGPADPSPADFSRAGLNQVDLNPADLSPADPRQDDPIEAGTDRGRATRVAADRGATVAAGEANSIAIVTNRAARDRDAIGQPTRTIRVSVVLQAYRDRRRLRNQASGRRFRSARIVRRAGARNRRRRPQAPSRS
jgi:hypothetical protein